MLTFAFLCVTLTREVNSQGSRMCRKHKFPCKINNESCCCFVIVANVLADCGSSRVQEQINIMRRSPEVNLRTTTNSGDKNLDVVHDLDTWRL
ncbi:hypothetical protein AB6A40_002400 [Gnathostoma spinigerum]|uniref:Secreted protein n=1 Tax=Gnathostoma spinigerum TaxID=75299 RepID=A0ABD6E922_9BILA